MPSGNEHVLIVTNRYSKCTTVIHIGEITWTNLAPIFLDNWIFVYGIPNYVLSDNSLQLLSKFLTTLFLFEISGELNTTASRPQTNGKVEI